MKIYSWGNSRKTVIKRDGKYCKVCCVFLASEVHHIKARVDGGDHNPSNLIYLCRACHLLAPFEPEEFKNYKENGGLFWTGFYIGVGAKGYKPKATLLELKEVTIRTFKKAKKYENSHSR